ncbi:hypothetical protein [Methylomonas sp. MgM2]
MMTSNSTNTVDNTAADPASALNEAEEDSSSEARTGSSVVIHRPEVLGPEEQMEDDAVVERVGKLEHEVGWILVTAGAIGMIVPGILGTPFLLMGAFALWPGNRKRVEKWRQGHTPKFFHGSMKQINRFLDDLERRYPRNPKDGR